MEFREWFCLKERESFTVDPKVHAGDSRFYFGRHDWRKSLVSQLRRSFVQPGVPKMLIFGPYGSGKTQTLYHIDYMLHNERPNSCRLEPLTLHVELEMNSRSDYRTWHLQLVEALGMRTVVDWITALIGQVQDLDKVLLELFADANMVSAVKNMRGGGNISLLAWRWFCGHELRPAELEALGVTRTLGELGTGDMVNALVGFGALAERQGHKVIFLMDEAEQFRNVKLGDASESLHSYLRKLSEPSNSSVGFVIAGFAPTRDDMPELLVRPDIISRLGGNNVVDLPYLPSVKDVKVFLTEMLAEFIDRAAAEKRIQDKNLKVTMQTYPFTSEAFDQLCDYASQDPVKALPRYIIKCVSECAISAWDDKSDVVGADIVNEIAPLVFA